MNNNTINISEIVTGIITRFRRNKIINFTSSDIRDLIPRGLTISDSYLAYCIKKEGYIYNRIRTRWEPYDPILAVKDTDIRELYHNMKEIRNILNKNPINSGLIEHFVQSSGAIINRLEKRLLIYQEELSYRKNIISLSEIIG